MPNEEKLQKNLELQVYQEKQLKKIWKVANHVSLGLLIVSTLNKVITNLSALSQTIPYLNLVFRIAKCLLNLCTLWFGHGSFKHKLMKAAGNMFSIIVSVVLLGLAAIVGTIIGLTMYSLRLVADSISLYSVIKGYLVGNWHREQESYDQTSVLLNQKISEYVQTSENSPSKLAKYAELETLNNQVNQEAEVLRKDRLFLARRVNKVLIDLAYISGFILCLFPATLPIGATILAVTGAYQTVSRSDPYGLLSSLGHTLFGLKPKPKQDLDKMIMNAKDKLSPAFSSSTGLIHAAMPKMPLQNRPPANHGFKPAVLSQDLCNKKSVIEYNAVKPKNNGIITNNACRIS